MTKIGFLANEPEAETPVPVSELPPPDTIPVKSVAQVHFPEAHRTLSYYNDRFDLRVGDFVYVEGKLEGMRGQVLQVSRSFKIRLSDYKRVIGVADTRLSGRFYLSGSHFLTFSPHVLPYEKALTWFKAPENKEEAYVTGDDSESFDLEKPWELNISKEILERGERYYQENRVSYLCVSRASGKAIVEGTRAYEVEFGYQPSQGTVTNMTCDCPCFYHCKHEVAVILQLQELLDGIQKNYASLYEKTRYVAAVSRKSFFQFAGNGAQNGSFIWNPGKPRRHKRRN